MIELNYRLTLEDFLEFSRTYANRRRPAWIRYLFWAALLALTGFSVILDLTAPAGERNYMILFIFVLLLIYLPVMKFWLSPKLHKKRFNDLRMGHGAIAFSADSQGIVSAQSDAETKMDWGRIEAVTQSETQIVLWLSRIQGFIVPLRAFASPEKAEEFLTFTRAQIAAKSAG